MSGMMGTSVNARPSEVRMFLRADSPEGLVRLQLQANTMLMGRADFTNIQFVDGFWYAWFLVDVDRYSRELEKLNGIVTNTRRPRAG